MSRRKITAGSTSITVPVFIQDTSSTTGAGLGSLVYNSSGLAAKYRREGESAWTNISLATATVGTFTSGGFIADGGPVTGGYEFGVPNVAIEAGAKWAEVLIYGATNMLPVLLEFELDTVNYQATNGKLPVTVAASDVTGNVAADVQTIKTQAVTCGAGVTVGVYVGGTSASALEATSQTILADTNELQTDWADGGRLDLILDARLATAGYTAPDNTTIGTINTKLGSPVASVSTDIAAVKTDTGNLVTRITSTLFSGITSLAQWLGLMAGKQVGDSTARTELRATGAGSGTFDETTESLEATGDKVMLAASYTAPPSAAAIDTQLSGTHGSGAWGSSGSGSGAYTLTVTVNDGATALQNATLRLVEGVNNFTNTTNASGIATFSLDAATYSVAITKDGYSFTPTTKIVSGTGSQTYSMSAVTITPSDVDLTTGYVTIRTAQHVAVSGASVDLQITRWESGTTGSGIDDPLISRTTNVSGYVEFTGLPRSASYRIRVANGPWSKGVTADAATTPLVAVLGTPV